MALPTLSKVTQTYEGVAVTCAKIVCTESSDLKFPGLVPTAGDYAFQIVIKASASRTLTISVGDAESTISAGTSFARKILIFEDVTVGSSKDLFITFPAGTYYLYNMQFERANLASAWRPAPEDAADEAAELANEAKSSAIAQSDANARALIDAQTQADIFNKLTNNGQTQGIYLQDGKIYINGSYIQTGTILANLIKGGILKLGGLNNIDGVMEMYNASGTKIGEWTREGIKIYQGRISDRYGYNYWIMDYTDESQNYLQMHSGMIGPFNVESSKMWYGHDDSDDFSTGVIIDTNGLDAAGRSIQTARRTKFNSNGITWYKQNDDNDGWEKAAVIDSGTHGHFSLYVGDPGQQVFITNLTSSEWTTSWATDFAVAGDFSVVGVSQFHTGPVYVYGNLIVSGTKNRVVSTEQYSDRLLYCYETASPMFGDVGEGQVSDDGIAYIWLDPVFAQAISTDRYQVFLQKYGNGDLYVLERHPDHFIVKGTAGLGFGWEIKAKQADYDQRRLDRAEDNTFTVPSYDYGAAASEHIQELYNGRISA